MGKSKKNRVNVVYSTNPDFDFDENNETIETLPFNEQKLYVSIDRKNRGGKSVTLVEGFVGNDEDAKDLSKKLKQQCGVGGGYKDAQIYIQGNHRDKVFKFLEKLGAKVKFKGG
ncbi:MAG: translation initiation factor [Flavobacteriales bacterium]